MPGYSGAMSGPRTEVVPAPAVTRSPARIVAPLIAFGLTWAARTALTRAYQQRTGRPLPSAQDRTASLGSVIVWASVIAVSTAVVDALVQRAFAAPIAGAEPVRHTPGR